MWRHIDVQADWRRSWTYGRAPKHKLGRGRWDLTSCQVSLNSLQRFQRKSRKFLNQSEARRPSCFFLSARKHKLARGHWDLASCQVSLNFVQRFQRRSGNCLSQSVAGAAILFSDRPEKHKLARGRWDLASCQVSLNSLQRFYRGSKKMYQPFRGRGGHPIFPIDPISTNLLEDVEILLPVKFRWIPFSGFTEEVKKNVSAIQRPRRPSYFSDRPEKHKLARGCWDIACCQVWLHSFSSFRGEVENVSANHRPCDHLVFSNRPE